MLIKPTPLKLKVFISVAKLLQPFLTVYQIDKPMIFFLSETIRKIIVGVLQRFVKAESLKLANSSVQKIVHFDFKDVKNQCNIMDVDLGYVAEKEVKTLITSIVVQGENPVLLRD
ncbi:hypothetical protein PR048_003096 [Dryococelus australis]|uniref:Uncharacterized protein n=1 Tax=Dryococelus australis TaxID=614101 RepID=A0ABQ9IM66_9NEOP|nr:hypothetical protein PR048_003096 [Dryococelus australis]